MRNLEMIYHNVQGQRVVPNLWQTQKSLSFAKESIPKVNISRSSSLL